MTERTDISSGIILTDEERADWAKSRGQLAALIAYCDQALPPTLHPIAHKVHELRTLLQATNAAISMAGPEAQAVAAVVNALLPLAEEAAKVLGI